MSIPDVADLITIAARVLEIDAGEAVDLIDVPDAEAALSGARTSDGEPAEVAAALLTGLIRHHPQLGDQQVQDPVTAGGRQRPGLVVILRGPVETD
jgi:hypothetical protein